MSKYRNNSIGSLQVSNLHPDVTETMLFNIFSASGQIIAINIVRDETTRQSLGVAYVHFERRNNAENALKAYNLSVINFQTISIKWNEPDENLRNYNVNNIFIKNLDRSIDNKLVYNIFLPFGEIISCRIVRNNQGTSKGFGYIQFKNEESVERAIEKCNGLALCNRKLIVQKFIPRDERQLEYAKRLSLKQNSNRLQNTNNSNNLECKKINSNECTLCNIKINPYQGIVLSECCHTFCIPCMTNYIHLNGGAGELSCPIVECYGYLQGDEMNGLVLKTISKENKKNKFQSDSNFYKALLELQDANLIITEEKFECIICFDQIEPLHGVRIRACLHEFCKTCLIGIINNSEDARTITCPFINYKCEGLLEQREIQELLSAVDYDKYLENTLKKAELCTENSYHCKTPNCKNFWIVDDNIDEVACTVCKEINCLKCKSIHMGYTCEQYRYSILASDDKAQERISSQLIQNMILNKNAMECTTCKAIVEKVEGCDAIVCSCKTELCWATKGARWGPGGKGDISGGCRCRVNGVLCTPTCNYCH